MTMAHLVGKTNAIPGIYRDIDLLMYHSYFIFGILLAGMSKVCNVK